MRRLILLLPMLLFALDAISADPPTGRVTGRIDCQVQSGCIGSAALWRVAENVVPAPDRYVLVPEVVSALQADGSFELVAPVDEYYAGALLRGSPGPLLGAPRVGDQIFLIKRQDENGYQISVTKDQVTELGTLSTSWSYAGFSEPPSMGIRGQVLDLNQQPVAGLLVFAFADSGATTTPLVVSERTGKDGSFVLPMVSPGPVFLRARKNHQGGQPQAGDYVRVTSEDGAQPILVEADRITAGVRLLVRKLPSVLKRKNAPLADRPQSN